MESPGKRADVCVKAEPSREVSEGEPSFVYVKLEPCDIKTELTLSVTVEPWCEVSTKTDRVPDEPCWGTHGVNADAGLSEDKPFKCDQCSYATTSNTSLIKHAKKNHTKVDYEFDSDDVSAASDKNPDIQHTHQENSDSITDSSDYACDHEEKTEERKSNEKKWKRNLNKAKRAKCLPYNNSKKDCPAKAPQYINCSRCKFKCTDNIPEEIRNRMCKLYWGLADYGRQKDFILKHVHPEYPKQRKVNINSKKARHVSIKYYLENSNGKQRVCANFFQKTLNISSGPITTAIKHKDSTGSFIGQDKRGKKDPGNKTSEQGRNMVKKHIESFPAMESHHVCNTPKKLYLKSNLSIPKMHRLYKDIFCTKHGIQPVSEKTYRRILCSEYNYTFFKPKKDLV